jgi:hypothetical protein
MATMKATTPAPPLSLSTIALRLFILVAPFVVTEPAVAQSFSYGHSVIGKPSCVVTDVLQSEEVTCVSRAKDNTLHALRFNPRTGAILGLQPVGLSHGSIVGNPSCVGSALIACAARGHENELYAFVFDPVTFGSTAIQRLRQSGPAIPFAGDPSCVQVREGGETDLGPAPLVRCGIRGADNGFYVASFLAASPMNLGASIVRIASHDIIVGDPSCALASGFSVGIGGMSCAARGAGSSLAIITYGRGNSFRYTHDFSASASGYMIGDPSCASTEVGRARDPTLGVLFTSSTLVTCAVRGSDSALYVIRLGYQSPFNNVYDVIPFSPPGGVLTENASCASTTTQVVTCGVRGTNGILHMIDFSTATGEKTTYEDSNEMIGTAPTCVVFGAAEERNVLCAVLDLTNGLSSVASQRPPM